MNNINLSQSELDYLFSPVAIRERTGKIFELCQNGQTHFEYKPEKFDSTVDYVLSVINKNYPTLEIPFHSRWGHFRVGGVDRVQTLNTKLSDLDPLARARAKLDLVITSVLLDAGAGADWKYFEKETEQNFFRSEGLGVASLYMFLSGIMSGDKTSLQADKEGLAKITEKDLIKAFQVSEENPLVGVKGRVLLLNNLAKAMSNTEIFKDGRPGNIIDYLTKRAGPNKPIPAAMILRAVIDGLGVIWPGRLHAKETNLGDIWLYKNIGASTYESLVPFHKLSQWLTYSLIEPIQEAGFEVSGVDELTGLAEYRNGGLLIDSGLIQVRNSEDLKKPWTPESNLIIEWRALTICLLDQIGAAIQKSIGKSSSEFPLAKVLEGGTWWAGRFLAKEKRTSGDPPVMISSDGTVF